MTTSANGRTERKSLAGQLDRLDMILDGLADGLNEAVAAAVKAAVTAAVEAAVTEVLTSAELQRRLHPQPSGKPGWVRRAAAALCRGVVGVVRGCRSGATALVSSCCAKAAETVSALRESGATAVARARPGMTAFTRQAWLAWFIAAGMARRLRKPLIVAAAVGTALALACYLAGPAVSSLVNGVAGFLGALAAGALARVRPALRRLAVREWGVGRTP
jgi:hypothetical protein